MCLYFPGSVYTYLSLSPDLFLLDDVTALTCPLGASYLGYLRKYQRLLHCSQEAEILMILLILTSSLNLFLSQFVSIFMCFI